MDKDMVKKPSHYVDGRQYEPKDVIRDWNLNFNIGSAVKYLSRAGRKDDIVQDLRKAQEFIQFEIDAIELERATGSRVKHDPADELEGTLVIELSGNASPEEIINEVIELLYGGKQCS